MTDERRGWRRYAGHCAVAFLIPHAVRGIAHLAWGADSLLVGLSPVLVCCGAVLVVLIWEMYDLYSERQGPAKTLIDLLSKTSGAFAGLAEWWV